MQATVSGPITGGRFGRPFAASMLDVEEMGYVEDEYLLTGTATRYRDPAGTLSRRDGHWQVEPAGEAAFETRLLVYRPADPARFNGTVLLNWNNVTAGYELFNADSMEVFEGGFALACLSTQKAGIEGLPPVHQGLSQWDPERYGSLSIPSDDFSYDIFAQAALAVGPDRSRNLDPLGGLEVRRVVAMGASQSAGRLATYINAIAPMGSALDGFILTIYFGRGAALEVGDAVLDIGASGSGRGRPPQMLAGNLIRDDLGIPIFVVNSELEAIACRGVRQDDTSTFRCWESAGTCHVSQQVAATRQKLAQRDELVTRTPPEGINAIPMQPLFDAACFHMQRWLTDGVAPPIQPKVEFAGEPPEVVRDQHGIARGGIRLPQVEVPLATNSAIPLGPGIYPMLYGSCHPFRRERAVALYGNQATYLARFTEAAEAAVSAGVLRPRDVPKLIAEATALWPR